MIDKERLKEIQHNSGKVLAGVSISLITIIMILGYFIPFYMFVSDGNWFTGIISDEWKFYFYFVLLIAVFSMIWPGLKLTTYFYNKIYNKK
tara:strand:- start:11014 stop:11286 length:273 start_codon:yes stop_codon:yes gene_type:complete